MKKTLLATAAIAVLGLATQAQAKHKEGSAEKTPPPHSHHTHAYVEFPPTNADGNVTFHPEMYKHNTDHLYISHGGYFWYPHPHAGMVAGYTPYMHDGMYWYPSTQDPMVVYMSDTPVAFVYPHSMDQPMDDAIGSPMEYNANAPTVKPPAGNS